MYSLDATLAADLLGAGPALEGAYVDIYDIGGDKTGRVEIFAGKVTQDGSSAIRWTCDLTIPSLSSLLPEDITIGTDRDYGDGDYGDGIYGNYRRRALRGLLLPLANSMRVFKTFTDSEGDTHTVPLGRYVIEDAQFVDDTGDEIQLMGVDYSGDISRNRWRQAYEVARGTNIATAVGDMVTNRRPGTSTSISTTSETSAKLVYIPGGQTASDPWGDVADLASAAGWEVYFDRTGTFCANPDVAATGGTTVFTISDTINARKFVSHPDVSEVCNTVVAIGENSGETPCYATATVTDGPFGTTALGGRRITREHRSSSIKNSAQATNAANRKVRKWSQVTESVACTIKNAPHLEVEDLVEVNSAGLQMEEENYRVQRVDYDLKAGAPTQVVLSRRLGA